MDEIQNPVDMKSDRMILFLSSLLFSFSSKELKAGNGKGQAQVSLFGGMVVLQLARNQSLSPLSARPSLHLPRVSVTIRPQTVKKWVAKNRPQAPLGEPFLFLMGERGFLALYILQCGIPTACALPTTKVLSIGPRP